jgi:hypothetical protein
LITVVGEADDSGCVATAGGAFASSRRLVAPASFCTVADRPNAFFADIACDCDGRGLFSGEDGRGSRNMTIPHPNNTRLVATMIFVLILIWIYKAYCYCLRLLYLDGYRLTTISTSSVAVVYSFIALILVI